MRAIELADSGRDLAGRPFAHRLLEQVLLFGEVEVEHQPMVTQVTGLAGSAALPEKHFAKIALQQELFGDAQRLEHALDVAIRQRPLLAARGRVRAVLKIRLVDDDVPRVFGLARRRRLRGDEKRQQHAVGPQHPRELLGQLLAPSSCPDSRRRPSTGCRRCCPTPAGSASIRNAGKSSSLSFTDVTVDVLGQILDDDLAAELLAEEADVGADDRTEIEQHRLRPRTEAGDETREHFGWVHRGIGRTGSESACSLRRRENRSESDTDVMMTADLWDGAAQLGRARRPAITARSPRA